MGLIEALILGIVQGLTEFLPVSSDGHLTLVPFALGWDTPTLAFTVAAHVGTLIALLLVVREPAKDLARTFLKWGSASEPDKRLATLVLISTVPAVVAGVVLKTTVEEAFSRPVLAALFLGIMGYVMLRAEAAAAEHDGPGREMSELTTRDALLIGAAQATALLPGVSRSGMTLATSLHLRLDRSVAVRFSFLMALPVIGGAALYQVPDMISQGALGENASSFAIAIVAAGVSGFFAARWLLRYIAERGLRGFGIYCLLAAGASMVVALARG